MKKPFGLRLEYRYLDTAHTLTTWDPEHKDSFGNPDQQGPV
jgi:hypothetical protein